MGQNATKGVETQRCPESLMCPVCLDVFEDATLLNCGHTFCRKCLREDDASHQDRDHMVCPVCRKYTELQSSRVEGLPANVSINGLVDDYRNNAGLFAAPKVRYHQALSSTGALSISDRIQREHPTRPAIRIKNTVELPYTMWGMAAVSDHAVAMPYCYFRNEGAKEDSGVTKVDSEGNPSQYFPGDGRYNDLAYQSNTGSIVVSSYDDANDQLRIYTQNGSEMSSKKISYESGSYPSLTSNAKHEIIIADKRTGIMIYDPTISTKLCYITTKDKPGQAFETSSGAIIASTCCYTNPGKVTAYDRSGAVGDTLTADPGEQLYAAVDNKDRVYVASVNQEVGKVVITQYNMDGLKFKVVFQFEELKLTLECTWCYMVSLSCDMLAFACSNRLYFIEVHPA